MQLFVGALKIGGSEKVESASQWQDIARSLGFPQAQWMVAAQDLRSYWQVNLSPYERYMQSQHQQRRAMADPMRNAGHGQGIDGVMGHEAVSPVKQMHSQQGQQIMQPPLHLHAQYQLPPKHIISPQQDARQPLQNGYNPPRQGHAQGRPSNVHTMPPRGTQTSSHTAPLKEAQKSVSELKKEPPDSKITPMKQETPCRLEPPDKGSLSPHINFGARNLDPPSMDKTYGGFQIAPATQFLLTMDDLMKYKLSVPRLEELGMIDVRALTLSLRSGIHAEVRLALDNLASLSLERNSLSLAHCEDLLESLIDCAEDQVDLLAEHAAEVSDAMLVSSYEDVVRACKIETVTLQEIPAFGTLDYELDRAVDRLICTTTILRNFSDLQDNLAVLAEPMVIRFLSTVIRYLGTRSMVLRTNVNVLDFSKDCLVFLANVSAFIDLPGKEEALCILHFLLSFAPTPAPNSAESEELTFSTYIPAVHRYYPLAVDALAKLLARDDPNRTFYRSIFTTDSTSTPPYDLLTRAFGLAIAAIPEYRSVHTVGLAKLRAPFLVQGLLAAEIIASLIPASDHGIAYKWLTSRDGFALSLLRTVSEFSRQPQPPPRHPAQVQDPDPYGIITMTNRGLSVLRKLAEKAKDAIGSARGLPVEVLPDKRIVLSALLVVQANTETTLAQLRALSALDT